MLPIQLLSLCKIAVFYCIVCLLNHQLGLPADLKSMSEKTGS